MREDFPSGAAQTGLVSGGAGGEVGELAVGRSGLGDGLVAFRQGPFGNAAIVAAQVTAPPAELILSAPKGWVKPAQAVVTWQPAVSADGPLRYSVVLDGQRADHSGRRSQPAPGSARAGLRAPQRAAAGDRHRRPVDALSALRLLIDGEPPAVTISRASGGYGVSVQVRDPYTGVDIHAVSVSFGDGRFARGRKRFGHRYARGGIYQVVVHVRDKLGNAGVVQQLVSVR